MLNEIYQKIEFNFHNERDILKEFQSIKSGVDSNDLKAEIIAFQLMENNQNMSDWNTYFGSYARFQQEDGSTLEIPSIKDIDMNVISYWKHRIGQSQNPVLKARYSGLLWDFSRKVSSEKPSHETAVIYIQSLIAIVENRLQIGIALIRKIKRAMAIAISINNKELINSAKQAMLNLEDDIGDNDKPGLWGFSFDSLSENKKAQLTTKEENHLIQKLENRLTEVTAEKNLNVRASEFVIKRLAPYYRKKNKLNESKRVLLIHGNAIKNKKEYPMILQYQNAIKNLSKWYLNYGMKEEANELFKIIKNIGTKVFDEMQPITSEVQISKKELQDLAISIASGSKEEVFHRFILFFIPKVEMITKELFEMDKEFPFNRFFGNKSILDETGRETANIGTLENDLIGNILHSISHDLQFKAIYMDAVYQRIVFDLGFNSDDFLNFISKSPVFDESRIPVLRKGIKAYFDKDYIVCEHLLIPQIETAIRNIIEKNDGVVLEFSASDAFHLKTFNKLLIDSIIKNILGEDIQTYLRALYTDPRGWNLRNKICHGLSEPHSSTKSTSERVIHSLLILGILRTVTI